jgi:peptide deformylase
MVIKELTQIGDPDLLKPLKTVTNFNDPQISVLIKNLKNSLHHHELTGIAANQIAGEFRIFVTEVRKTTYRNPSELDKFRVYINPEITELSSETVAIYEGCGSVAYGQLMAEVDRAKSLTVKAFDEHGKEFSLAATGLLARVILHEIDHLDNIEFITKVKNWRSAMSSKEYKKRML